ncbi:MAG: hypothetical protein L0387_36725 [Acidobacteria bacterium]|nr:hypothetical protein [Acidobacteriota bacterium]
MNRAPRIALIVDHPQRDLAGLLLLAYELCQRGAICHLVPHNLQTAEIWSLAPDFVLLNALRRGSEDFARQMATAGIQFGALDTEGGVWPSAESYAELLWEDRSLLNRVSCMCMWGEKLADYLIQTGRLRPDQIHLTGCPRFDLYQPVWHGLSDSDGSSGTMMDSGRAMVLINTNLYTVNSKFVTTETNLNQMRRVYGWSETKVQQVATDELTALERVITLARNLSCDFPYARILLRPHPYENMETYQRALSGLDNLEVNGEGPVQPRILRAAAVVQRSCTTAIEAAMVSRPALSPQWIPAQFVNPMAESVSLPCESYDDLKVALNTILRGQYEPSSEQKARVCQVIKDWFYRVDGLAYQRVSQAIVGCLGATRMVNEGLCAKYLYQLIGESIPPFQRLMHRLRFALRLSPYFSFRQMRPVLPEWKQGKRFGLAEVDKWIADIEGVLSKQSQRTQRPRVMPSREFAPLIREYDGHSLTLACERQMCRVTDQPIFRSHAEARGRRPAGGQRLQSSLRRLRAWRSS